MRAIFLLSGLTLLIACDDAASDKAGDTASTDDAFAPTAGQWNWQGTTYGTDECNMADAFPAETVDATRWDLVLTDDGFSLDNEIWTEPAIQCTVTGMDFSCSVTTVTTPEAWPDGSDIDGAPDATYTAESEITGAFSDADYGNVAMNVTFTCEGVDCEAHGEANGRATPCDSELSGDFTLSE